MDRRAFLAALATFAVAGCESLEAQGLKLEPPPPHRDPDVPYVPTRQEVVEAMLTMAGVRAGDVVYDLGCGDGRIVITAAQRFGARGVGIDINPTRISEARYNARRAGVEKQVEFKVGDLFEADIRNATVVTLYLLPEVNLRLKPKLQRDLKPGTRIVSHDFSMGPDWPAEKTQKVGNDTIFFWTIK
jgi:ubiquinone/menaquinone biosynthesis C-methylase UbiE